MKSFLDERYDMFNEPWEETLDAINYNNCIHQLYNCFGCKKAFLEQLVWLKNYYKDAKEHWTRFKIPGLNKNRKLNQETNNQ